MKIALLGTRGVPAAYGGFETLVENIGQRLAGRGHDVSVYCRPHMVGGRFTHYRGMRLVFLPTIASKHLDTIVHTLVCTLHMAVRRRPDVAVYFIAGNSPLAARFHLARRERVPAVDRAQRASLCRRDHHRLAQRPDAVSRGVRRGDPLHPLRRGHGR